MHSGNTTNSLDSLHTAANYALAEIRKPGKILGFSSSAMSSLEDMADDELLWRKKKRRKLFADAEDMKQRLREHMTQPEYDVSMYYHATGRAQAVAKHQLFEVVTLSVIAFNGLWEAVDTDMNENSENGLDAPVIFRFMDNFFCAFFFSEIVVRFIAFKCKLNCFKDFWFVYDTVLVVMMVGETWVLPLMMLTLSGKGAAVGHTGILRLARIVRLARMMRLVRLLRACPEIVILVKGMGVAMRSVIFTLVLQVVIIYVFSIAFRKLTHGTKIGDQYFACVPESMHTLLRHGTFMDNLSDIAQNIQEDEPWLLIPFYAFVLISALTLMNMLIGVLCDVVVAVATVEKESLDLAAVNHTMSVVLKRKSYDQDFDGFFSREKFSELITDPDAVAALKQIDIDVVNLVDMLDIMFEGDEYDEACDGLKDKKLSFGDLMAGIVDLRGTKPATVKDVVELRKFLKKEVMLIQESLQKSTHEMLANLSKNMRKSFHRHLSRVEPMAANNGENPEQNADFERISVLSSPIRMSSQPPGETDSAFTREVSLGGSIPDQPAELVGEEALVSQLSKAIREEHNQLLNSLRSELMDGAKLMGSSLRHASCPNIADRANLESVMQEQLQLENAACTKRITAPAKYNQCSILVEL